jgi:glucokinase
LVAWPKLAEACLGEAAQVLDDEVQLTNNGWTFSIRGEANAGRQLCR